MKNRNGFTLIELLVTIAIMALILIMIMPAIKSLQETNKKKEYGYYKDSLIEAAKLYVTKEGEDINSSGYSNWKGCVDITYNDLIVADLIKPFQDENIDCSNSMIRYTKNNKKTKYTYKVVCVDKTGKEVYNENTLESEEECEVVNLDDKTPPECGSSTGENTEWTKENVTITMNCIDTESGCTQSSVKQKFTKDTKTANIEIQDKAGNKRKCPVNVYIDKTPPLAPKVTNITFETYVTQHLNTCKNIGGGTTNAGCEVKITINKRLLYFMENRTDSDDCSSGVCSGIKSIQYYWQHDGGAEKCNWSTNCAMQGAGTTGVWPTWIDYRIRLVDQAGNIGPYTRINFSKINWP